MAMIPEFSQNHLERICEILGDTVSGLSGSQIGKYLNQLGIEDGVTSTKRVRLFEALGAHQKRDRCGNLIGAFIEKVMDPVRHTAQQEWFENKRHELNKVLAFSGYSLGENGKLQAQPKANTIPEAERRADRLRTELSRRGVHSDVLRFCRAELLQSNYFHAVFEATKSVADKIRSRTNLDGDGGELIDKAFGSGKAGMPFLAFNSLRTETERGEHTGLMNLMKGMFGAFRNVTAHAPKITWPIEERDAFDLLTIASFIHRRLDSSIRTPRQE